MHQQYNRPDTTGGNVEKYRTDAGSTVEFRGAHRGAVLINFDWFEEHACPEAIPGADISAHGDAMLSWVCPCCEPGSAKLEAVNA